MNGNGQGPRLTPEAAHNAAAALVEMYAGIVADQKRTIALQQAEMERMRLENAKLIKDREALILSLKSKVESPAPAEVVGP